MEIRLATDSDIFKFPLMPNTIQVKSGAVAIAFQVIKKGEHKIPRGIQATGYSWSGTLPGKGMADQAFVSDWQRPKDIIKKLKKWMEKGQVLKLRVTGSAIKDTVFIENFTYNYIGYDRVDYTINLTKYRELKISTAPPQPEIVIPKPTEEEETQQAQPPAQPQKPVTKPPVVPPKKTPLSVTIPTSRITKPQQVVQTHTPLGSTQIRFSRPVALVN